MFYYNNIFIFSEIILNEDIGLKEYKKLEYRWYRKYITRDA